MDRRDEDRARWPRKKSNSRDSGGQRENTSSRRKETTRRGIRQVGETKEWRTAVDKLCRAPEACIWLSSPPLCPLPPHSSSSSSSSFVLFPSIFSLPLSTPPNPPTGSVTLSQHSSFFLPADYVCVRETSPSLWKCKVEMGRTFPFTLSHALSVSHHRSLPRRR